MAVPVEDRYFDTCAAMMRLYADHWISKVHGEPVLTMTAVKFLLRRTAADEAASPGYS